MICSVYRQGSKIKTMNISFLKMIFKSDLFAKDYQLYLGMETRVKKARTHYIC